LITDIWSPTTWSLTQNAISIIFSLFQLDFFAPLKSLLLSSTLDSAQGSGTSTPSRAAVVDSKAIRKAHCQVNFFDKKNGFFKNSDF